MRALRIAVASSVLGTSFVGGELGHATILRHLREVESAVKSARKVRHIDIESELLVLQVEDLVAGLALEEVDAGTNVLLLALGDELESKRVAGGGDTVSARVVGTIESAVLRARRTVGAQGGVPGVA